MASASRVVMLAAAIAAVTGAAWLAVVDRAPEADTLRRVDGLRYNTVSPSEHGALAPCAVCHRLSAAGAEGPTPSLRNIIGSAKGASRWFGYSPALATAGGTWTAEEIDDYLADPVAFLPGTSKTLSQVRDPEERRRIVDALRELTP